MMTSKNAASMEVPNAVDQSAVDSPYMDLKVPYIWFHCKAIYITCDTGPLPTDCLSVQPSPSSRYLAVLTENCIVILQKEKGYRFGTLGALSIRTETTLTLPVEQQKTTGGSMDHCIGEPSAIVLDTLRGPQHIIACAGTQHTATRSVLLHPVLYLNPPSGRSQSNC